MQRFITTIIALVAAAGLVTATPAGARIINARDSKYNPAIAMGTFSDGHCSRGQVDLHRPDGSCEHLPGQSMKIWWLAEGCRALVGECSNSVNPVWYYADSNNCINVSDKTEFQVYC